MTKTEEEVAMESVKVFELVRRAGTLPTRLEDLIPLSFIGSTAVRFYQGKIKLMKDLNMSEEQRKATLRDGQEAGELLLAIEARIGELLPPETSVAERRDKQTGRAIQTLPGGLGDTKRQRAHHAEQARAIHRNPAAVKAIIAEAKENEDIPTKTAVLNKIAADEERARRGRLAEHGIEVVDSMDDAIYLSALNKAYRLIAEMPPSVVERPSTRVRSMLAKIRAKVEELLT